MTCERCGGAGAGPVGQVVLCDSCVVLIVVEWRIHREEFAVLAGAEPRQGRVG